MDKNFISIDDLVRQRLGGEEEKERPGAWLQMRDLLDKEMPQDRGGFLYWRRTLGAIALVLLAGGASVGSYFYATRSLNASNNNAVVVSTSANNNLSVTNAIADNATKTAIDNTTAKNSDADNTTPKHSAAKKTTNDLKNNKVVAGNQANNDHTATTTESRNTTKTANSNDVNDTKQLTVAPAADSKKANNNPTAKQAVKTPVENLAAITPATHADRKLASAHSSGRKHSIAKTETTKKKQFLASIIATNDRNKKAAAESRKKEANKQLAASNAKTSAKNHTLPTAGGAHHSVRKSAAAKVGDVNTADLAATGKLPTPVTGALNTVAQKNEQTANMGKLALGSGTTGTKTIPAGSPKSPDANEKPLADNNSKPGRAKTGTSKKAAGSGTGNGPGVNNAGTASRNGTAQTSGTTPASEEVAAEREKVSYDRVTITEHFVCTNPKEGYYKYDTISIEQLARDLGINGGSSSAHHPEETRKEENTNSTNSTNAVAAATSPIVPESSASATGKNGLAAKQAQTAKSGTGESTLDKLNATFNDVKYHVSGMQFAPGLTGGINATFFGPNSFKGFQFGATGNFIFGDNVSAMAELKYFHRINNNYSLDDNYYTYTQVGAGQWSKQQLSNSYSFSTLHSIEMPITIRYMKSHFSFYAGANLVYSFSINTGKSEQPSALTPILVNAMGNDNTPKVQQSDFNSRFGVGYIAGLSYEVYPNVTLDFRNVQTVWDNGASQGAKYISNQLYKSPSFQVSVGYRLGNNKKKD